MLWEGAWHSVQGALYPGVLGMTFCPGAFLSGGGRYVRLSFSPLPRTDDNHSVVWRLSILLPGVMRSINVLLSLFTDLPTLHDVGSTLLLSSPRATSQSLTDMFKGADGDRVAPA